MAKKEKEVKKEEVVVKPERVETAPNKFSKRIEVTLEQLASLEKEGKLVGNEYTSEGKIIALIR